MLTKKRINVHLFITPVCNLRCKHCYYDSWPIDKTPENLLTITEICHIIAGLSDNHNPAFDVEGGEFFIREDIADLFKVLPFSYLKNITITTNGTVPIHVDLNYLKHLNEFRVSIEGHTDNLQQELRGIGIKPVINTYKNLQLYGLQVVLRITLFKKNYKRLSDILSYFTDLGFSRFSFYEFQPTGRGIFYKNEYGLNSPDVDEVINQFLFMPSFTGIDILKLNLSSRRVPNVKEYQNKLNAKGFEILDLSGIPSLTIDYDGNLGLCPWEVKGRVIGKYHAKNFFKDLNRFLEDGILNHSCNYCSAIRILYKSGR